MDHRPTAGGPAGGVAAIFIAPDFENGIVWIKWIGTHRDYDRIDVREVEHVRTKADYKKACAEVERLWGARHGTTEGDRLDVLATLRDAYEAEHYPMDPPELIEAIEFG